MTPPALTATGVVAGPRPTSGSVRTRHYVMCAPTHFDVRYAINPWMDPHGAVDVGLAVTQWQTLRRTYLDLGHIVDLLDPEPDLPDMVFAANGGLVIGGRMFGASFAHPQRRREADHHRARFRASFRDGRPGGNRRAIDADELTVGTHVNEGEGDFLVVGERILAGYGFRTEPAAHHEAERFFGRPVVSLRLVDPRFYHLDVAVAVLDDDTIAYYPPAFAPDSVATLRALFPDAIVATDADALALGLNLVSDGYHVVLPEAATGLAAVLTARGYDPIPIDLSELRKAGGSVKCATMELHP